MGALALPTSGTVYVDTNGVIYSVERVEPYRTVLHPLWERVQLGTLSVVTSDITLLETLVGPLKTGNKRLEDEFHIFLQTSSGVSLVSITHPVLERAANLRATTNLKTPDAIHAATALEAGCALFLTNDPAFKRVPGLPVAVLSEVIAAP